MTEWRLRSIVAIDLSVARDQARGSQLIDFSRQINGQVRGGDLANRLPQGTARGKGKHDRPSSSVSNLNWGLTVAILRLDYLSCLLTVIAIILVGRKSGLDWSPRALTA